jgi:hypothetical protein
LCAIHREQQIIAPTARAAGKPACISQPGAEKNVPIRCEKRRFSRKNSTPSSPTKFPLQIPSRPRLRSTKRQKPEFRSAIRLQRQDFLFRARGSTTQRPPESSTRCTSLRLMTARPRVAACPNWIGGELIGLLFKRRERRWPVRGASMWRIIIRAGRFLAPDTALVSHNSHGSSSPRLGFGDIMFLSTFARDAGGGVGRPFYRRRTRYGRLGMPESIGGAWLVGVDRHYLTPPSWPSKAPSRSASSWRIGDEIFGRRYGPPLPTRSP